MTLTTLAPDLRLRLQLARLPVGDCLMFEEYAIWRDVSRFRLLRDGKATHIPRRYRSAEHEFGLRRIISEVVAYVCGAEAAPELAYRNLTRRGIRYECWHYDPHTSSWRVVLYADTAEDAHEEYMAWKRAQNGLIFRERPA